MAIATVQPQATETTLSLKYVASSYFSSLFITLQPQSDRAKHPTRAQVSATKGQFDYVLPDNPYSRLLNSSKLFLNRVLKFYSWFFATIAIAPRFLLVVSRNSRLHRAIRLEIGADIAKCRKFVPCFRIRIILVQWSI
jgi:hypothetical protein